jgi:hypothetical protein
MTNIPLSSVGGLLGGLPSVGDSVPANQPATQKDRQIYFRVVDWDKVGVSNDKGHLLSINPEDLTYSEPSRVSVQQTLGSAWVDSFGKGLRTITISGTTGWRAKHDGGKDWEEEFIALHSEAFRKWHGMRDLAIIMGDDPDQIQMEFVDSLDGIAVNVIPQQFVLKRSKSRPLLMQYNITMAVLSDIANEKYAFALNHPDKDSADESLLGSMDSLVKAAKDFSGNINKYAAGFKNLLKPIGDFLKKVNSIMASLKSVMNSVGSIFTSIVSVAQSVAQAGRNIFATLAAIRTFPQKLIGYFQQVGLIFTNLVCLFKNGLRGGMMYSDYSDFYGSSNCSSTSGGRPLSPLRNVNGFSLL